MVLTFLFQNYYVRILTYYGEPACSSRLFERKRLGFVDYTARDRTALPYGAVEEGLGPGLGLLASALLSLRTRVVPSTLRQLQKTPPKKRQEYDIMEPH